MLRQRDYLALRNPLSPASCAIPRSLQLICHTFATPVSLAGHLCVAQVAAIRELGLYKPVVCVAQVAATYEFGAVKACCTP